MKTIEEIIHLARQCGDVHFSCTADGLTGLVQCKLKITPIHVGEGDWANGVGATLQDALNAAAKQLRL